MKSKRPSLVLNHFSRFFLSFSYEHTLFLVDLTLGSRNLKDDLLASKLVVDGLERLELVVNDGRVLVVEDDLLELGATNLVSNTLANDLGGEDKVLEDAVVNGSESSGHRALLGLAVAATGLGENAALGKEDDVTVRELLLELTGQSLLNLVDGLEGRRGEEDDNSLLATGDLDLKKEAC